MSLLLALLSPASSSDLSLGAVEGADVLAANTQHVEVLQMACVEGADTSAGTMALAVDLSGAMTDGADVFASNVSLLITASMAATEGADVLASGAGVVVVYSPGLKSKRRKHTKKVAVSARELVGISDWMAPKATAKPVMAPIIPVAVLVQPEAVTPDPDPMLIRATVEELLTAARQRETIEAQQKALVLDQEELDAVAALLAAYVAGASRRRFMPLAS